MIKKTERRLKIILARVFSFFFRSGRISPEEFKRKKISKLLVIRQHDQMGDMLLAVPALRGLRKRYPDALISLVASAVNSRAMKNNPYIDELIVWPESRFLSASAAIPRLIARLRSSGFDAAIVLNTVSFSVTSMLIAAVSGAEIKAGCSSEKFGHDLTALYYDLELPLPSDKELGRMHETEHNLYPLRSIGIEEDDLTSIIVPSCQEKKEAEKIIEVIDPGGRGYAVIHPGAGKKGNRWPAGKFARVGRDLYEKYHIPTIAVRGPADLEAAGGMLAEYPGIELLLSSPDVGILSELMRRSAVTICNDTGVMHIAGASGARAVAVFGPTDKSRWKPVNSSVIAVFSEDGDISSVEADEVFRAVESIISGVRARSDLS
ncbi:MAG: glycosyltransferase family 9 protein [Candidatus Krumholzibacteriota bacterium]|nr:glycosyltransferase family 9 protein [Candidatus Krumholzibacteriota bacterium]